eukprot:6192451-Pleurochrysis_carterae.AAC.6
MRQRDEEREGEQGTESKEQCRIKKQKSEQLGLKNHGNIMGRKITLSISRRTNDNLSISECQKILTTRSRNYELQ